MSDLKVDNYKATIKSAYANWREEVAGPAKELGEIDDKIRALEANKTPSAADKKKLEECKQQYLAKKAIIEAANRELERELTLIRPPAKTKANADEFSKVPEIIKATIKERSLKVSKNITIEPMEFKFDIGTLKLKSGGFNFKWRF